MKLTPPSPPAPPRRLSLVVQTVQSLREGIRTGHWQQRLPSERALCEHLQVSRVTLRSALRELESKGWLDTTGRSHRRIVARHTSGTGAQRKRHVVLLTPALPLAMSLRRMLVMDTVRANLARVGCITKLCVNAACFSPQPSQTLEKAVRGHPDAVWVVFGSRAPMQHWFREKELPCLIIGSCHATIGIPSVDVDHHAACRHAGHLLVRKSHRRLALVLPRNAYDGDVESEEGLRKALATRTHTRLHVLRHDGTAAHLCTLLDAAMHSPNPPTAYVVARALHVLTVMMHLMRRGKRIPQDVAVISRDDDPFLQSTCPAVTRYGINPAQLARRVAMAARQLAETGTLEPKAIRLMPKYLPGETV